MGLCLSLAKAFIFQSFVHVWPKKSAGERITKTLTVGKLLAKEKFPLRRLPHLAVIDFRWSLNFKKECLSLFVFTSIAFILHSHQGMDIRKFSFSSAAVHCRKNSNGILKKTLISSSHRPLWSTKESNWSAIMLMIDEMFLCNRFDTEIVT